MNNNKIGFFQIRVKSGVAYITDTRTGSVTVYGDKAAAVKEAKRRMFVISDQAAAAWRAANEAGK